MELFIFDRDLNFKGILDNFFSFSWRRRYYKYGEFELQCVLTPENLNLLQRENIIYKKDDTEAGYIEHRNLKQDADGKEILVVQGKFLTGYLNRRIIWGTEYINDTAESAMRILVNDNCINPSDSNRVIPNLVLGNLNRFTKAVNYQVSYANLSEELESLSHISDLGHRINFDISNRKLIFDVYEGIDRGVSQSINPRAIFSKEFENVLEQEYLDSLNNYKNTALIGGMGEGIDRKLITLGDSVGLERYELFVDAKDISNTVDNNGTTITLNETQYNNLLTERGKVNLAEFYQVQTFDNKINLNSNLKYKADFDLGDIVTCVSKKWGITIDTRITEIEEIYEESGPQVNVTFGNNVPTLIDKIKQKLR